MNQLGTTSAPDDVIGDATRGGRPWWQICCGGCLALIVAAIVATVVLLQTIAGPGIVHLASLPSNFPSEISPLKMNEARSIDYLAGKNKSKVLKTLYAPISLFSKLTGRQAIGDGMPLADANKEIETLGADAQKIDTVTITWKPLHMTPSDALMQYTRQFVAAGLTMKTTHDDTEHSDVVTGLRDGLIVQLSLKGSGDAQIVDEAQLVVSYSNK